jgi:hypothetical protein
MRATPVLLLTLLSMAALPGSGQEKTAGAEPGVYRVEFNIHDAAEKTGHRYTMIIAANGEGDIRAGARVPYGTGPSQISFADIGTNVHCGVTDVNGHVRLKAALSISSVAHPVSLEPAPNSPAPPTIGEVKVDVNSLVPLGKPTTVASIDDPTTFHHFDVEATVTKVE